MTFKKTLIKIKTSKFFKKNIKHIAEIEAREAKYLPLPKYLFATIKEVLEEKNIKKLYSHQAQALNLLKEGKDLVIVTPTASGKSLCYNLPILNSLLVEPETRALYIFPTKALAQDQVTGLNSWLKDLKTNEQAYTYDGDTPSEERRAIREKAKIIVTNPDMLHGGILPNHKRWQKFFTRLSYLVIDELHIYRGVFGSHVAHVLARLERICNYYGSKVQIICTSATIANPQEHAQNLLKREFALIDDSGAPQGKKEVLFYNPPLLNKVLGIRGNSLNESHRLATSLIEGGIQTIIFTRSRQQTEILATSLNKYFKNIFKNDDSIRAYRGGYLAKQRRKIEEEMRTGKVMGIVSTNALELGIDIGSLGGVIVDGYPGTIASTWQQIGRAGRNMEPSLAIIVASGNPLDQFIINNPQYLLEKTSENALINAGNPKILAQHFKCALYELPFLDGEKYNQVEVKDILTELENENLVEKRGRQWTWQGKNYPAFEVSLRNTSANIFKIFASGDNKRLIGEVDGQSAPLLIHQGAIYIHGGKKYLIDKLDYETRKAYGRLVDSKYYTKASMNIDLDILSIKEKEENASMTKAHGEVLVIRQLTAYKKIRFSNQENLGWHNLDFPEEKITTNAYWFTLDSAKRNFQELEIILEALVNLWQNIVPLELMCAPQDIKVVSQLVVNKGTIFVYDNYPGGVGFSEKLFSLHEKLLVKALQILENCSCKKGCPSCVGPPEDKVSNGRKKLLNFLTRTI